MSMDRPTLKEIEVLFEQLKQIKDDRINTALALLESGAKVSETAYSKEYQHLNEILGTEEAKDAFKRVLNEQFDTIVHSFLVMIDGGTIFKEDLDFYVDLVKNDTRKSLSENDALHEWLFDFWYY